MRTRSLTNWLHLETSEWGETLYFDVPRFAAEAGLPDPEGPETFDAVVAIIPRVIEQVPEARSALPAWTVPVR